MAAQRRRGPGGDSGTPDEGRRDEGRRGDGRPRGRTRGKVLLAVGVIALTGWAVLISPLIAVRDIHVSGTRLLPKERVVTAAGVAAGTPMARVDLDTVRRRVASIREVESVVVARDWPAALRITVRERRPIAVVAEGGRYAQLDRFGVRVVVADHAPPDLPVLVVEPTGSADPIIRACLAVLVALPPDIAGRVTAVEAVSAEAVTLRLRSGPLIVWGAPERAAEKLRALRALLWSRRSTTAKEIDVSAPEVVSTR